MAIENRPRGVCNWIIQIIPLHEDGVDCRDRAILVVARPFHETRQQSLLSGIIKLTENLFLLRGSMIISLYTPGHAAGTPVRAFEARWTHYIGRGNGADGYSFNFGDLRDDEGGELLYAFDVRGIRSEAEANEERVRKNREINQQLMIAQA